MRKRQIDSGGSGIGDIIINIIELSIINIICCGWKIKKEVWGY